MKKNAKIALGLGVAAIAGITLYSMYQKKQKPSLYIKNSLPFGATAITVPPVGVFVDKNHAADADTLNRAVCDWSRYQQSGWLLYYLQNGVRALMPAACPPVEDAAQAQNNC